jgi:MSHA biogenesis protein MshG
VQAFAYTARDAQGQAQHGVLEAVSPAQIASQLIGRGLTPVAIRATAAAQTPQGADAGARQDASAAPPAGGERASTDLLARLGQHWRQQRGADRPPEATVTLAIRELAALLKAGIPILRALQLVAQASDSTALREAFGHLIADLDAGRDIASALDRERERSGCFQPYDVAMVRVGEQTGRIDHALHDLYDHREFMRATQEQVAGALRYPSFVIATCVAAMVVINLFVIPAFAKVFANLHAELPLLTRVLLAVSHAMVSGWPYLLAAAAVTALGVQRWLATERGALAWDRWKLRLPLVGDIVYRIVMARFASAMATSLGAGLTVTQALQTTAQTLGNRHVAAALEQIRHSVERGESLSHAAQAVQMFPPALLQMMVIGEETGALDELLREIAKHYHSEVEYAVKRLSSALEPILILLLGAGVLVLALGVFLPMWELGRVSLK